MTFPAPDDPALLELHPVRLHNRITVLEGAGERLTENTERLASLMETGLRETAALRDSIRQEGDTRRAEHEGLALRITEIQNERIVEKREAAAFRQGQQSITYRLPTKQLVGLIAGVGTLATAAAAIIAFATTLLQ